MVRNTRAIAIATVALLVLAAVGAAVVLQRTPRVTLSGSPTDADHLTLYQNGLAFVALEKRFSATGDDVFLVFSVPTTTILDSLSIEGEEVVVKEIRSSLAATPLISPGDVVVVHFGPDESYRGTVLSAKDGLLLSSATGTVVIDPAKATAIEIEGRTVRESGPGTTEVQVLVSASAGGHDVRLTYLAAGPGWTPNYALDPETGDLTFFATLTGLDDYENITLDLVSGSPRLVATPSARQFVVNYEADEFAAAPTSGAKFDLGFGGSSQLGDLHVYRYDRTINLTRGETLRLPVLQGEVDVLRHYYGLDASVWGGDGRQDVRATERYLIKNTLSEPLPPGIVRVYLDGVWIGEDMLPPLPVGDQANVTVADSNEVKGTVVAGAFDLTQGRERYEYVFTVRNFRAGAEPVDVRATLSYPSDISINYPPYGSRPTRIVSVEPAADETEGRTLIWNRGIPSGGSASFRVTYERVPG